MIFRDLEDMRLKLSFCDRCSLVENRKNVVFGEGNPNADLMFIGEAPGFNEDEQGRPFVGQSGMLLNKFLKAADISRDNAYITNIVKCRPLLNRDPEKQEQNACIRYLFKEIEFVQPKLVVCLGRISSKIFIKDDFKVSVEHGKWFFVDGMHIMGTYHPSALLRFPSKRQLVLADFLGVKRKMEELGVV